MQMAQTAATLQPVPAAVKAVPTDGEVQVLYQDDPVESFVYAAAAATTDTASNGGQGIWSAPGDPHQMNLFGISPEPDSTSPQSYIFGQDDSDAGNFFM